MKPDLQCIAFENAGLIASGALRDVVLKAHKIAGGRQSAILVFDDETSELIEVDFRGSARDLLRRLESPKEVTDEQEEPRRPGRPKLGVVAREVTLLPRHWDWLHLQPGGASVALRRLVDEARRINRNTDRIRRAKEAAYRFMAAMAGNETGFEEATRGLFAGDAIRFAQHSRTWPRDVRDHAAKLAARAFE